MWVRMPEALADPRVPPENDVLDGGAVYANLRGLPPAEPEGPADPLAPEDPEGPGPIGGGGGGAQHAGGRRGNWPGPRRI